jgi:site-specific recombinase XerD
MLEELERRNYSEETTRRYPRFVERFAQHFGKSPDKLGPEHIRTYQAYLLKAGKLDPGSVENHVAALRFLFVRTLNRHELRLFIPYPRTRRKLPKILSQEEVTRLIIAAFHAEAFIALQLSATFAAECHILSTSPDC